MTCQHWAHGQALYNYNGTDMEINRKKWKIIDLGLLATIDEIYLAFQITWVYIFLS